ncbi:hypothetical protein EVAR_55014_1 [Eumeta japonica]|uniref:Uncharacterized protein n=1 Tax=Eumeta variegata TaxID=151549 RepID=A0A4C1YB90_EUMVA|nr:hypothetical protein EVAR_55014_1 [Eumeta japonica]
MFRSPRSAVAASAAGLSAGGARYGAALSALPLNFLPVTGSVPSLDCNLINLDETSTNVDVLKNHVQKRMTEAATKDEERFERGKAKVHHFQKDDYVLIKNGPRNQTILNFKFSNPYKVCHILDNDRDLVT